MRRMILFSAGAASVVAAIVFWSARPESTFERVAQTGTIRVGYVSEPPFSFPTPAGGASGEGPEIARVVLGLIGVSRIEWVHTEFRSLIPDLLSGRFDMIAAGMFVNPERARQIVFSTPTYQSRSAFVVRSGDEHRLDSYDKLRTANARVALLAGAFEQRLAVAARISADRMLMVPDITTAVAAVRSGGADAFAITAITARRLARAPAGNGLAVAVMGDTMIHGVPALGRGAYGFRPGDAQLRDVFDAELRRFLGTPEHRALVRAFGFTDDEMPSPAAAQ